MSEGRRVDPGQMKRVNEGWGGEGVGGKKSVNNGGLGERETRVEWEGREGGGGGE